MIRFLGIGFFVLIAGCDIQEPADQTQPARTTAMTSNLQSECRAYLEKGPPPHMENYVPESLTEIVIAHGAKAEPLDSELSEIASIVLMESQSLSEIEDAEIRQYMQAGADLVQRVLDANK